MNIDQAFRNGLKDDLAIFDGKVTLRVHHNLDGPSVNWADGTTARSTQITEVDNCIFRQDSLRNGPSVPQIHQRDAAIQKDQFANINTVIEIPRIDGLIICDGDMIEEVDGTRRWRVLLVDKATLGTRWRVGVTVFR